ncbi:MAG: hypothetical protein NZ874_06445 [Fimbriimonadales bacterium]|nr:hypothetical protein [Fimbriimonadales bacterium]
MNLHSERPFREAGGFFAASASRRRACVARASSPCSVARTVVSMLWLGQDRPSHIRQRDADATRQDFLNSPSEKKWRAEAVAVQTKPACTGYPADEGRLRLHRNGFSR